MLYRYPQAAYPYADLVAESVRSDHTQPEYEITGTGVFADNRFFDMQVSYAKASETGLVMELAVTNHRPDAAPGEERAPIAEALRDRLVSMFRLRDGARPSNPRWLPTGQLWDEHITFSEYFLGDTGAGLGATHQTGWTALVADLICAPLGTRD